MNGDPANSANQRVASHAFRNDSALQGATIAFNDRTPKGPPPHVKRKPTAAAAAAIASTANCHAGRDRSETGSEVGPEVGSVKDKIGRLTGNSLSPQAGYRIAARLAVTRSPSRASDTSSTAARLGAIRSASRMQSQPPTEERREVRSPIPIRPIHNRPSPMDSLLRDDKTGSDRDIPTYTRSPSQRSRASESYRDNRFPSPQPSVRSQRSQQSWAPSEEPKPKLPPRSTPSQGSLRKHAFSGTPLRPSTPSLASVSGQSHNSSSSAVDEFNGMSEEALSNAIVASSLASTRASPASKVPPPPPPQRRRTRSLLHLPYSPKSDLSRTPSPPKGMPQTLRGMPKHEDADAHRRHKMHLLHKHPHKHHEGDRKRWRREVTEKERKRYEGVWASNKGILVPRSMGSIRSPVPASDMVLNLVAREIWTRSRLPSAVLEQVWDLVDHQNIGLLTKEEFVVGMWLIDQQLKGHKLPVKVPDSVWDSVRHVAGIRLPLAGNKGGTHA
ncbi:hypothetical protein NUU61_004005 [Penicillium alfredii]|uniref:EH domain-containing protein n=1 Tax=Penicillium alfredii TaxID=1506179 RepID=A0A9W9FKA6_9EURO|nr:uncharacterized protein NUU61_004005 [Penicillium alfredii]KAJ5101783.1 hypothetical protein NUU61_004005 [Penicillium alfredii]